MRTNEQKELDFMVAYGGGPSKLAKYPNHNLADAAASWEEFEAGLVSLVSATVERSLQTRIDEEGCGAFFAAAEYPPEGAKNVAHTDTVSVDTSGPCHGDVNGDLVGAKGTHVILDDQVVS